MSRSNGSEPTNLVSMGGRLQSLGLEHRRRSQCVRERLGRRRIVVGEDGKGPPGLPDDHGVGVDAGVGSPATVPDETLARREGKRLDRDYTGAEWTAVFDLWRAVKRLSLEARRSNVWSSLPQPRRDGFVSARAAAVREGAAVG